MVAALTFFSSFILIRLSIIAAEKRGYDRGYRCGTYDASKMHVDTERFFRTIDKPTTRFPHR